MKLICQTILLTCISFSLLANDNLWYEEEKFYSDALLRATSLNLEGDQAYFNHKLSLIKLEQGLFQEALEHNVIAVDLYTIMEKNVVTRLQIVDARVVRARLFGFLDNYAFAVIELLSIFEENLTLRTSSDPETVRLYKHLGWHFGKLAKKELYPYERDDLYTVLKNHAEIDLNYDNDATLFLNVAKQCYEKALQLDLLHLGEYHPDTAKSYGLLGWVQGDLGHYQEALESHQKALEIRLNCHSEMHPNTARSYSNIGWCYEKLGNLRMAALYYLKTIEIMFGVLPSDHPELEKNKMNLARVL